MFGERVLSMLVSITVCIVGGLVLPDSFYPYITLIDIFSTYIYIFSVEKRRIDLAKKGEDWSLWDRFSFVRDYFLTCFVQGISAQFLVLVFENRVSDFSLPAMIMGCGVYMGRALSFFIVLLSFWDQFDTVLSYNFIYGCATVQRVHTSLAICNRFADLESASLTTELLTENILNGGSTLTAYTFLDIFFRGNMKVLTTWFTVRVLYLLVPYIQVYYNQLGLTELHSQIVQVAHSLASNYGHAEVPAALGDGRRLFTLAVLVTANHVVSHVVADRRKSDK